MTIHTANCDICRRDIPVSNVESVTSRPYFQRHSDGRQECHGSLIGVKREAIEVKS